MYKWPYVPLVQGLDLFDDVSEQMGVKLAQGWSLLCSLVDLVFDVNIEPVHFDI